MANCYWHGECESWNQELHKDGNFMVPWAPSNEAGAAVQYHCYPPVAVPPWAAPFERVAEDRAVSASRSHSEAEKRRRERINAQLATLRKLIPKSEKMDKAALLGHAVEHVKELGEKAKEVSKISIIPTEIDDVTIDYFNEEETNSKKNEYIYIKTSVCCDDRPELFAELNNAFKGLGLTTVEADMTSLGGRVKIIFVLCAKNNGEEGNSSANTLKKSLKLVLTRIALSSGASNYTVRSKRQRFFFS